MTDKRWPGPTAKDRCHWCGMREDPDHPLIAVGRKMHVWIHWAGCWEFWYREMMREPQPSSSPSPNSVQLAP